MGSILEHICHPPCVACIPCNTGRNASQCDGRTVFHTNSHEILLTFTRSVYCKPFIFMPTPSDNLKVWFKSPKKAGYKLARILPMRMFAHLIYTGVIIFLGNYTFFSKASSRTGSVRSLVRSRLVTLCGGLGSNNNPTLSQLPANDGAAKLKYKLKMKTIRNRSLISYVKWTDLTVSNVWQILIDHSSFWWFNRNVYNILKIEAHLQTFNF